MRQNAQRNRPARHFKAEAGGTVADVEAHAALQGASYRTAQFAGRIQNAVRFAVIAVGNDVAAAQQIGDFIEVRRIVANVHHQRQIAVFLLNRLGARQRRNAVFSHHAAAHPRLQTNDKIGMTLHRLLHRLGVNIGHIGQFILGNQPDAGDIEQGIDFRRRFTGQLIELIDIVGAGAAGINHGGDAGGDANAVRLIVIYRRIWVAVNVGVNPAGADVAVALQIDGFTGGRANLAQRPDFPVLNGDISQGIVDEARAAQE